MVFTECCTQHDHCIARDVLHGDKNSYKNCSGWMTLLCAQNCARCFGGAGLVVSERRVFLSVVDVCMLLLILLLLL